MLSGLSKIFRRDDTRGIDGDKPRDPYLDVLKEIQSPRAAQRASLRERASQAITSAGWRVGKRGG